MHQINVLFALKELEILGLSPSYIDQFLPLEINRLHDLIYAPGSLVMLFLHFWPHLRVHNAAHLDVHLVVLLKVLQHFLRTCYN
jgi:hypothetical protein